MLPLADMGNLYAVLLLTKVALVVNSHFVACDLAVTLGSQIAVTLEAPHFTWQLVGEAWIVSVNCLHEEQIVLKGIHLGEEIFG